MKKSLWGKYGYAWVTLVFFLVSLLGHWIFAWYAYVDGQLAYSKEKSAHLSMNT